MNNLKFRAYIKSINKVLDVLKVDFKNKTLILDIEPNKVFFEPNLSHFWWDGTMLCFEDVEIMQSTGYKDKKGIEIFIGDIVKFPDLYGFYDFEGGLTSVDGLNVAIVVKKGNCITLDNFVGGDGFTERELENYECTFDDLDFGNFEIIGNIYENKELLENDR